jgi:UDP-N-acetylglucosamine 1-carboxyvinyltransferase
MKKLRIEGKHELTGTIRISGAKNSSVALIPAALLASETVTICNVPEITDTDNLCNMLEFLGATVRRASESVVIDPKTLENKFIPEVYTKKLRASYYFMGALLGKYKHVELSLPGGCSIGARPINLHLKGFEALGATVDIEEDKYILDAKELKGANIYLDIASVGATINIMLAACLADGKTVIENAAKEPEIVNVATFLNNMGAKIKGAGTSTIKITGVKYLHSCFHEVIPDRIEAGTYLIIASLIGKDLTISNIIPNHLEALIAKLNECGVEMEQGIDYIRVLEPKEYKATSIKTLVYPGFPTDLQQIMATFLTQCKGRSVIEETIYENRFLNLFELNKMGADTKVLANNQKAIIKGKTKLIGTEVNSTDLRGGASLLVAALIAEGTTTIDNIGYILRGYDKIVEKLSSVGAKIEII